MSKKAAPAPDLPLVGDITRYLKEGAPKDVRKAVEAAHKHDILDPGYP